MRADHRVVPAVFLGFLVFAAFSLGATSCSERESVPSSTGKEPPVAKADESPTAQVPTSHHSFERAADWVERFEGPQRDAWQRPEEVLEALKIEPGMTVADLGAGTGYFLPWLSRAVGETGTVFALDVEPDMVRHMDQRAEREELLNVRAKIVPPGDPLLPEGAVDRVLVVNTWHHMEEREAYATKLARALTVKGQVFIIEFTRESPRGPPPEERLSPETVIAELEAAGLEARTVPVELPHQYVVVGTKS